MHINEARTTLDAAGRSSTQMEAQDAKSLDCMDEQNVAALGRQCGKPKTNKFVSPRCNKKLALHRATVTVMTWMNCWLLRVVVRSLKSVMASGWLEWFKIMHRIMGAKICKESSVSHWVRPVCLEPSSLASQQASKNRCQHHWSPTMIKISCRSPLRALGVGYFYSLKTAQFHNVVIAWGSLLCNHCLIQCQPCNPSLFLQESAKLLDLVKTFCEQSDSTQQISISVILLLSTLKADASLVSNAQKKKPCIPTTSLSVTRKW